MAAVVSSVCVRDTTAQRRFNLDPRFRHYTCESQLQQKDTKREREREREREMRPFLRLANRPLAPGSFTPPPPWRAVSPFVSCCAPSCCWYCWGESRTLLLHEPMVSGGAPVGESRSRQRDEMMHHHKKEGVPRLILPLPLAPVSVYVLRARMHTHRDTTGASVELTGGRGKGERG